MAAVHYTPARGAEAVLSEGLPPPLPLLRSLVFLSAQIICLQFGSLDLQALVLESEFTSINCELYLIFMLEGREECSDESVLLWKKGAEKLPTTLVIVLVKLPAGRA